MITQLGDLVPYFGMCVVAGAVWVPMVYLGFILGRRRFSFGSLLVFIAVESLALTATFALDYFWMLM